MRILHIHFLGLSLSNLLKSLQILNAKKVFFKLKTSV